VAIANSTRTSLIASEKQATDRFVEMCSHSEGVAAHIIEKGEGPGVCLMGDKLNRMSMSDLLRAAHIEAMPSLVSHVLGESNKYMGAFDANGHVPNNAAEIAYKHMKAQDEKKAEREKHLAQSQLSAQYSEKTTDAGHWRHTSQGGNTRMAGAAHRASTLHS
jgi:hypothetical protein